MAYEYLKRVNYNDKGKVFSQTITIQPSASSVDYIFPIDYPKDIGVSRDVGTPQVYFTFSEETIIKSGGAQWILWDGTSEINKAVTGVRITNPEIAAMEVCITVRVR